MSTKIYDAYKMKNVSAIELKNFISFLKEQCLKLETEKLNKLIAAKAIDYIDEGCFVSSYPEMKLLLYEDVEKFLVSLYRDMKECPGYLIENGPETRYDSEKVIDALKKYKFMNTVKLTAQIIQNKVITSEVPGCMSNFSYRVKNEVVFFPISQKRILFMVFGNAVSNLLIDIVCSSKNDKWYETKEKYQIREYHYQNQTDRPDSISARDWNKRRRDWEKVCPQAPSDTGIVVTLTDHHNFQELMFQKSGVYMQYINPKNKRIEFLATTLTKMKICSDRNIKENREYFKVFREVEKKISEKRGNEFELYKEFVGMLDRCLIDIDEDILEKQITEFYPMQ